MPMHNVCLECAHMSYAPRFECPNLSLRFLASLLVSRGTRSSFSYPRNLVASLSLGQQPARDAHIPRMIPNSLGLLVFLVPRRMLLEQRLAPCVFLPVSPRQYLQAGNSKPSGTALTLCFSTPRLISSSRMRLARASCPSSIALLEPGAFRLMPALSSASLCAFSAGVSVHTVESSSPGSLFVRENVVGRLRSGSVIDARPLVGGSNIHSSRCGFLGCKSV